MTGKRKRISRCIWCTSSYRGPKKRSFTSFPPTPVHLRSPHCWLLAGPSSKSPLTCPTYVPRTHSRWFVTGHVPPSPAPPPPRPTQLCLARFPLTFTRNPSTPRNTYPAFTLSLYRVESVKCVLIVGWRKISISSFRKKNRCWQRTLHSIVIHAFC
jgi:hypothetical protein